MSKPIVGHQVLFLVKLLHSYTYPPIPVSLSCPVAPFWRQQKLISI
jgi:hypothetical protein